MSGEPPRMGEGAHQGDCGEFFDLFLNVKTQGEVCLQKPRGQEADFHQTLNLHLLDLGLPTSQKKVRCLSFQPPGPGSPSGLRLGWRR